MTNFHREYDITLQVLSLLTSDNPLNLYIRRQLWRSMDADDSEACARESNNYNFVSVPHAHVWVFSLDAR